MPILRLETEVRAPRQRCFDLSRDIDLHVASMVGTGERAVAGRTSGLIGPGEEVTWEARHLGVRQRFTSRITAFVSPSYFQDRMVRGAFRSFVHDHYFEPRGAGTLMRDVVAFRSPLGPLGRIADGFLSRYLYALLLERQRVVKAAAEEAVIGR
jgi:ligand-binding SRPBCC domain-containing protein